MTKIMWVSRHPALPIQVAELKRLFGDDVQIVPDNKPFSNANDVVRRFRAQGADEMVIVAPLSVIGAICDRGIKPLYAQMQQVFPPERGEVNVNGRLFVFKKFQRVTKLVLEFEEIEKAH